MGRIKKGILGGFNGKVGNVVGSSYKGVAYMRSLPQSVANPRTPAQMAARARFTVLIQTLALATEFINKQVKPLVAAPLSPTNFLMRKNYHNGSVVGTGTELEIDFSKLDLGKGNDYPELVSANATVDQGQRNVNFTWDGTIYGDIASSSDVVSVMLINDSEGESIIKVDASTRINESLQLQYPSSWIGSNFSAFIGVSSVDGQKVSKTVFLGQHEA